MANLITGLFDTESMAENAVSQLKQIGYGENEISIVMKDRASADALAHDSGARTMEGVGAGAAIGGTIGAVLAGILAVGTVAIPGVGVVAAGAIAAMLAGAGAGGITGGLIGWLTSLGVSDDVAAYYERGISDGAVVVAVAAHPGDETRVQQVLQTGSVAYAGGAAGSYISPEYRARYSDINVTRPANRI